MHSLTHPIHPENGPFEVSIILKEPNRFEFSCGLYHLKELHHTYAFSNQVADSASNDVVITSVRSSSSLVPLVSLTVNSSSINHYDPFAFTCNISNFEYSTNDSFRVKFYQTDKYRHDPEGLSIVANFEHVHGSCSFPVVCFVLPVLSRAAVFHL